MFCIIVICICSFVMTFCSFVIQPVDLFADVLFCDYQMINMCTVRSGRFVVSAVMFISVFVRIIVENKCVQTAVFVK